MWPPHNPPTWSCIILGISMHVRTGLYTPPPALLFSPLPQPNWMYRTWQVLRVVTKEMHDCPYQSPCPCGHRGTWLCVLESSTFENSVWIHWWLKNVCSRYKWINHTNNDLPTWRRKVTSSNCLERRLLSFPLLTPELLFRALHCVLLHSIVKWEEKENTELPLCLSSVMISHQSSAVEAPCF